MKHCKVPGCTKTVAGHSTMCTGHRQASSRHGHPLQVSVTKHELQPYMRLVKARVAKNAGSELWPMLRQRWDRAMTEAHDCIDLAQSGQPYIRWHMKAADVVREVGGSVPVDDLIETALAMFTYRADQPRRFVDDRAFDFQLCRRIRGRSSRLAGRTWNQKLKRSQIVYRDFPQRVTEVLAVILKDVFGLAGLYVAEKEGAEIQQKVDKARQFTDALQSLT